MPDLNTRRIGDRTIRLFDFLSYVLDLGEAASPSLAVFNGRLSARLKCFSK